MAALGKKVGEAIGDGGALHAAHAGPECGSLRDVLLAVEANFGHWSFQARNQELGGGVVKVGEIDARFGDHFIGVDLKLRVEFVAWPGGRRIQWASSVSVVASGQALRQPPSLGGIVDIERILIGSVQQLLIAKCSIRLHFVEPV